MLRNTKHILLCVGKGGHPGRVVEEVTCSEGDLTLHKQMQISFFAAIMKVILVLLKENTSTLRSFKIEKK